MQRQQFYPKQLIDVTAMMTLQATPQNGIKDALVSIGAKGIVQGLGLSTVLPYSWSFTISTGKVILEDGSIVSITSTKTITINPAIQTVTGTGSTFYAVFLIPKNTLSTPIVDPDGDTINYIESDDYNVVLVPNSASNGTVPSQFATAGNGYQGVRLGDIARYTGQTNIQPADIRPLYADYVTNNANLFDLSQLVNTYAGMINSTTHTTALNAPQGQIIANLLTAQTAVIQQIQAVQNLISPAIVGPDGISALRMAQGIMTLAANQIVINAVSFFNQLLTVTDINVTDFAKVSRLGNLDNGAMPNIVNTYTLSAVSLFPGSTDFSGVVNFVTGPTQIDNSERGLAKVTYARPYANEVTKVFFSPISAAAGLMGGNVWPQAISDGTGFFIHLGPNSNIPPNNTFTYAYLVVQ